MGPAPAPVTGSSEAMAGGGRAGSGRVCGREVDGGGRV